jgi:hypothetical protein
MTDGAWEIVGKDCQKFPYEKTVGDALRDLLVKRLKHRARKYAEEVWGLDPKTARNFTSNANVSERTLTKAARSEGWELWHALGVELFGETYAEHLRGVINEYEERRERTRAHRDHVQDLEEKALRLVRVLDRAQAE